MFTALGATCLPLVNFRLPVMRGRAASDALKRRLLALPKVERCFVCHQIYSRRYWNTNCSRCHTLAMADSLSDYLMRTMRVVRDMDEVMEHLIWCDDDH